MGKRGKRGKNKHGAPGPIAAARAENSPVSVTVQPTPVTIADSPELVGATRTMAATSKVMVGVSTAIFLGSLLQWGVLRSQLNVSNEALKQNAAVLEQMRLESRAWLTIGNPTVALEAGKKLTWTVVIKNYGKTPALLESLRALTVIRGASDAYDPATANLDDERVSQLSIGPDQSLRQDIRGELLTPERRAAITGESSALALYLVGQIRYKDASGESKTTDFFFKYEPDTNDVRLQPMHNLMR